MPPPGEQTEAHAIAVASAVLYSAMLAVALLRLLHHLSACPPRPFGPRKLFHILLSVAYASSFLLSHIYIRTSFTRLQSLTHSACCLVDLARAL